MKYREEPRSPYFLRSGPLGMFQLKFGSTCTQNLTKFGFNAIVQTLGAKCTWTKQITALLYITNLVIQLFDCLLNDSTVCSSVKIGEC